jgi:peptide/nickel transport system substrate-binding protein
MHPSIPKFNPNLQPYPYDPDKAKQLLADAGYPNGLTISFGYPTGRYLMDKQVGEAIIGQLQQVGIQTHAETADWGTFYNNRSAGKYDAFLYGFGAPSINPDYALQWFSRARSFAGNYNNPDVDRLLAAGDSETDEQKSTADYQQAQEIIWNDAPWAFLYYQPDMYGASKALQGFAPRIDEYFLLWNVSLSQ